MAISFMSKMVLSCKKAAEITDKKLLGNISFIEKLQLKIHRLICTCSICGKYEKNSARLDQALGDVAQCKTKDRLSEAKKKEIIEAVQSK